MLIHQQKIQIRELHQTINLLSATRHRLYQCHLKLDLFRDKKRKTAKSSLKYKYWKSEVYISFLCVYTDSTSEKATRSGLDIRYQEMTEIAPTTNDNLQTEGHRYHQQKKHHGVHSINIFMKGISQISSALLWEVEGDSIALAQDLFRQKPLV